MSLKCPILVKWDVEP